MYADMSMQNGLVKGRLMQTVKRPSIVVRVLRSNVLSDFGREIAHYAVDERGVSVALACGAFSISQRCFRYVPLLADENERIED